MAAPCVTHTTMITGASDRLLLLLYKNCVRIGMFCRLIAAHEDLALFRVYVIHTYIVHSFRKGRKSF